LIRSAPNCCNATIPIRPEGGVVELSSSRQIWGRKEAANLLHRRGGGLIIDYGTPRPDWLSSLQANGDLISRSIPLRQIDGRP
jgi:SAM-dependent MidA family methyltransferase